MLNADTVKEINKQIAKELDTVNSFISDDNEKDAALNRILKLKKILDPNPDSEQIMDAFVRALTSHQSTSQTVPAKPTLNDVFDLFRR